jgi:hypothetical protein
MVSVLAGFPDAVIFLLLLTSQESVLWLKVFAVPLPLLLLLFVDILTASGVSNFLSLLLTASLLLLPPCCC